MKDPVILLLSLSLLLSCGLALDTAQFVKRAQPRHHKRDDGGSSRSLPKRQAEGSPFNNTNTAAFAVKGDSIPDLDADAGESYAGQLPIGGDSDGKLFFWFWPTTNTTRPKEILIWLNGGPGCSSLSGLLKENGPFLWPTGTMRPVQNPWSWHHLTNVVYIEQPVGTGFATGNVTAQSEDDVATQFMGFWRNFVDAFGLKGYKVYITGESYAGMYCPYIASHFLDAKDSDYFDVRGMHIIDPLIAEYPVSFYIPANYFAEYWQSAMPFNESTRAQLRNMSATCGFDAYMDKYLTFPPPGPQPATPPGANETGSSMLRDDCLTADLVADAALEINPGWNIYEVGQLLPLPDDVLGFPSTQMHVAPGQQVYFNRTDVKQAIHAPQEVEWSICAAGSVFVDDVDTSVVSSQSVIPSVIERTGNVLITHGMNDFVLVANGTLLAIQNMTWGGQLGFQEAPASPLFVPHHDNADIATASGQGVMGTTHTERGLTWSLVMLTGHQVPTWQMAVAYRQTELLLGRIGGLNTTQPLGLFPDAPQPEAATMGGGVPGAGAGGTGAAGAVKQGKTSPPLSPSPLLSLSFASPPRGLLPWTWSWWRAGQQTGSLTDTGNVAGSAAVSAAGKTVSGWLAVSASCIWLLVAAWLA